METQSSSYRPLLVTGLWAHLAELNHTGWA